MNAEELTRFEVARIIGARALQISMGAPILLKEKEFKDIKSPIEIAKLEFKRNAIPLTVKRPSGEIVKIRKAIENWLKRHGGEVC